MKKKKKKKKQKKKKKNWGGENVNSYGSKMINDVHKMKSSQGGDGIAFPLRDIYERSI